MKQITYFLSLAIIAVMLLPQCQQAPKEKKAKYVFYFIGDGMGLKCIWQRQGDG